MQIDIYKKDTKVILNTIDIYKNDFCQKKYTKVIV
jgi:hypothetical protein